MSFGYSLGDFIAGANLSYRLIKALSETQGACHEYQEAIAELASLQQTFLQVGYMQPCKTLSRATINAAAHIVLSSMTLIGDFLAKTQKYRERMSQSGSGHALSDSWQKMGWALFKMEELKALKDALHLRLSNINVLLSAAQFHGVMPEKVAQFHEQSGNTFVSAAVPMKANALANPVLVDDEAANIALAEPVSAEDSVAEMTSDEESMARVPGPDVDSEEWDTHLDVLKYEQKGVIAELAAEQPIPVAPSVSSSKSPLNSILKGQQVKPEMQVASFEDQNRTTAVGTHSAASKSSRSTLQTDNTQEGSISNGVQLLSQLEHFLSQTGNLKKKQTKEPLKFKDAVGRKFSFPYDICATWPGIEELIQQAFMHVDIIGAHVQQGHYDLIGPHGEIILPKVWETMIEPGWAITMHMWPMPEPHPRQPQQQQRSRPPPPPGSGSNMPSKIMVMRPGSPPDHKDNLKTRGKLSQWMKRAGSLFKKRDKDNEDGCSTCSGSSRSLDEN